MTTAFHTTHSEAAEVARDDEAALLLCLRSLRGDRSLREAAEAIGIRADELSKIEQGRTKQIRWETLFRMLRTYRCGIDDLLHMEEQRATDTENPRAVMLAALRAGTGQPVPRRRLHVQEESAAGLQGTAAAEALAAPVERGPVRRKFTPAGSR
ncbi:MAG: helix-turn-helix transcriptional regulator [Mycobacteriales bacterium]